MVKAPVEATQQLLLMLHIADLAELSHPSSSHFILDTRTAYKIETSKSHAKNGSQNWLDRMDSHHHIEHHRKIPRGQTLHIKDREHTKQKLSPAFLSSLSL
jgi:hypothetical protein